MVVLLLLKPMLLLPAAKIVKVINAYDGNEVRVGERFAVPGRVRRWKKFRDAQPPIMTRDGIWDITPTATHVGVPVPNEHWLLAVVDPGFLRASATVVDPRGNQHRVPLAVRLTHPSYFFEHVAFLPT